MPKDSWNPRHWQRRLRAAQLLWRTGGATSLGHRARLWWRQRRLLASTRSLVHAPVGHHRLMDALNGAPAVTACSATARVPVSAHQVVVFTAVFGAYDQLLAVPPVGGSVRFICFTDDISVAAPGWEMRLVERPLTCPIRSARWYKIRRPSLESHLAYSIWMDGNLQLAVSPRWLIQQLEQHAACQAAVSRGERWQLATFAHPERRCIYQEARWVSHLSLDSSETLGLQMDRYRKLGHPAEGGLAETCLLVRRHSARVEQFERQWWDELQRGSVRDQLSFPFVAARQELPVHFFRGGRQLSPLVSYHPHSPHDPHPSHESARKMAA